MAVAQRFQRKSQRAAHALAVPEAGFADDQPAESALRAAWPSNGSRPGNSPMPRRTLQVRKVSLPPSRWRGSAPGGRSVASMARPPELDPVFPAYDCVFVIVCRLSPVSGPGSGGRTQGTRARGQASWGAVNHLFTFAIGHRTFASAAGGRDGMCGLDEARIEDIMRRRVGGPLLASVPGSGVPDGLTASVLRIFVGQGLLAACSAADVLDCAIAAEGVLPIEDLCDMHSVVGHRALMKMLALHPVVAMACGLDADSPIEDPVILAQSVVSGLAAMHPDRRASFLHLFREEKAAVAAAAGQAVRDVLSELAVQAAVHPEIASRLARQAAALPELID